jgi:hypothetical protein
VGVYNKITLLIFYYIVSKLVTLLEVIADLLQLSDISEVLLVASSSFFVWDIPSLCS